ncbi:hypothetical protein V8C86DRAFT_2505347 [Haematococcus lacustris]
MVDGQLMRVRSSVRQLLAWDPDGAQRTMYAFEDEVLPVSPPRTAPPDLGSKSTLRHTPLLASAVSASSHPCPNEMLGPSPRHHLTLPAPAQAAQAALVAQATQAALAAQAASGDQRKGRQAALSAGLAAGPRASCADGAASLLASPSVPHASRSKGPENPRSVAPAPNIKAAENSSSLANMAGMFLLHKASTPKPRRNKA